MRKNIIMIFGFFIVSCNQTVEKDNYLKDTAISNKDGYPKDSLTFYYPTYIKTDSLPLYTNLDSSSIDNYSCILHAAKEPVLYNFYQDHDIYRFLWLRSFHKPIVFSLHKKSNKVWLITKILNKHPQLRDIHYVSLSESSPLKSGELHVDSVLKADRKVTIVVNNTKQLSKKDWKEFEQLINNCSFWTTTPYIKDYNRFDGASWIIEGHTKNKYWFVNKWSPKDNFKKAGEFLIAKSELKEKIY